MNPIFPYVAHNAWTLRDPLTFAKELLINMYNNELGMRGEFVCCEFRSTSSHRSMVCISLLTKQNQANHDRVWFDFVCFLVFFHSILSSNKVFRFFYSFFQKFYVFFYGLFMAFPIFFSWLLVIRFFRTLTISNQSISFFSSPFFSLAMVQVFVFTSFFVFFSFLFLHALFHYFKMYNNTPSSSSDSFRFDTSVADISL